MRMPIRVFLQRDCGAYLTFPQRHGSADTNDDIPREQPSVPAADAERAGEIL